MRVCRTAPSSAATACMYRDALASTIIGSSWINVDFTCPAARDGSEPGGQLRLLHRARVAERRQQEHHLASGPLSRSAEPAVIRRRMASGICAELCLLEQPRLLEQPCLLEQPRLPRRGGAGNQLDPPFFWEPAVLGWTPSRVAGGVEVRPLIDDGDGGGGGGVRRAPLGHAGIGGPRCGRGTRCRCSPRTWSR